LRSFHRRLLELRQHLVRDIEVVNGAVSYRFRCETVREFNRCLKLFSKEPGTVRWIESSVQSGQIFYDIGANIGVYTILAARQVGPKGKVYAFEPHAANFTRLIENVIQNRLQQVVVPCGVALDSREGFAAFTYDSARAGTSHSQLLPSADVGSGEIDELKYATTVDRLLDVGRMAAPHHVKIDVDGNEHRILEGMVKLLASSKAPVTLQVEMNEPHAAASRALLQAHGYTLIETHYTRSASRRREQSGEAAHEGCNAIFRKAG
jgi:FkbM family methyltransferase